MRNFFFLFSFLFGFFAFSQLSKIDDIKRQSNKEYSKLFSKYKKKYPEERIKEEERIVEFQIKEIQKALDYIQKDEEKYDFDSFPKETTKPAEFESGISGFRKLYAELFDTSGFSGKSGTLKTMLKFVIDENGTATNAVAEGNDVSFNQEAVISFYRIKSKNYKWKPAEINGVPVKSVYRIPSTMTFE